LLPANAVFLSTASFANRSARKRSIRSRTIRLFSRYSVIALAPSLARSSFLKLASARDRTSLLGNSLDLVGNASSPPPQLHEKARAEPLVNQGSILPGAGMRDI
jgi:hypothetical protein